jgi:transcriptional regulator with XRE-family HTH domain
MLSERKDPRQADSTDIDVGRLVRVHRMAQGLSQTALADRIGVTFQQVQKYESGANRISMGRLARIARVLGVSVTYLLGGSREAMPAHALKPKEARKLVDATLMLGRIGALRLLRAFTALPANPPMLRESIIQIVEGTAAAAKGKNKQKRMERGRANRQRHST